MGIICQHPRTCFIGNRRQILQRRQIAIHREDSLCQKQGVRGGVPLLQVLESRSDIVVRESLDAGAR